MIADTGDEQSTSYVQGEFVESKIHRPGRWLIMAAGTIFFLTGAIGFFTVGGAVPPGMPLWIARVCTAAFALLGGAVWVFVAGSILRPAYIRHAAPGVLPNVPPEPVIVEGSVVHGRLPHELVEVGDAWQFRPAANLWRNDKRFLLGFGIPFMIFFAGVVSWSFHDQRIAAGWPASIVLATAATVVCGGSAFLLIAMVMRSGYRRLCCLKIPRNGDDLELASPDEPDPEKADLATGLRWIFLGDGKMHRLAIPRELVSAVQLCPWKFAVGASGGSTTTWAVQGSLVLACPVEEEPHRLPVMLTNDFVGAARLMQRLATTLQVPFLFCADAAGWKAEKLAPKIANHFGLGDAKHVERHTRVPA